MWRALRKVAFLFQKPINFVCIIHLAAPNVPLSHLDVGKLWAWQRSLNSSKNLDKDIDHTWTTSVVSLFHDIPNISCEILGVGTSLCSFSRYALDHWTQGARILGDVKSHRSCFLLCLLRHVETQKRNLMKSFPLLGEDDAGNK